MASRVPPWIAARRRRCSHCNGAGHYRLGADPRRIVECARCHGTGIDPKAAIE